MMRKSKKINLRDAAVFVLFIAVFFMIYPPIYMSLESYSGLQHFYGDLVETTIEGMLVDWAAITGIFIACYLKKSGHDLDLYMTFGFNKRTYNREWRKKLIRRGLIFGIIRSVYTTIFSGLLKHDVYMIDNSMELEYFKKGYLDKYTSFTPYIKDPVLVRTIDFDLEYITILTMIHAFVIGFLIYILIHVTKSIMDMIVSPSVKSDQIDCDMRLSEKTTDFIKKSIHTLFILNVWICCYLSYFYMIFYFSESYAIGGQIISDDGLYCGYGGVAGFLGISKYFKVPLIDHIYLSGIDIIDILMSIGFLPMELILPNSFHISLGLTAYWMQTIFFVLLLYITVRIRRKMLFDKNCSL